MHSNTHTIIIQAPVTDHDFNVGHGLNAEARVVELDPVGVVHRVDGVNLAREQTVLRVPQARCGNNTTQDNKAVIIHLVMTTDLQSNG